MPGEGRVHETYYRVWKRTAECGKFHPPTVQYAAPVLQSGVPGMNGRYILREAARCVCCTLWRSRRWLSEQHLLHNRRVI
jgi:hypothetical protein